MDSTEPNHSGMYNNNNNNNNNIETTFGNINSIL